jgi:hypothetical protein
MVASRTALPSGLLGDESCAAMRGAIEWCLSLNFGRGCRINGAPPRPLDLRVLPDRCPAAKQYCGPLPDSCSAAFERETAVNDHRKWPASAEIKISAQQLYWPTSPQQRNWKPEPGNFAISLAYDPSTALRYHFAVGPAVTQSRLNEGHKMIHFAIGHTNIPLLWAGYQL